MIDIDIEKGTVGEQALSELHVSPQGLADAIESGVRRIREAERLGAVYPSICFDPDTVEKVGDREGEVYRGAIHVGWLLDKVVPLDDGLHYIIPMKAII